MGNLACYHCLELTVINGLWCGLCSRISGLWLFSPHPNHKTTKQVTIAGAVFGKTSGNSYSNQELVLGAS